AHARGRNPAGLDDDRRARRRGCRPLSGGGAAAMSERSPNVVPWPAEEEAQRATAQHAAAVIREGGLVVYPTDTVYGLGCDPLNGAAIRRIYDVKGRPDEKAIIWLVRTLDDAREQCVVDSRAERLAERF